MFIVPRFTCNLNRFALAGGAPLILSEFPLYYNMYNVDIGNLSHLPGDDDLLCLPIEINKRLFIDDDQPVVISIG